MEPSGPAPITLNRPVPRHAPLLLTSPHSGRCYDPAFLAASRLDAQAIRRSEDSFVEELFGMAPALGAPLLAANFPRAWCDVNREPWELDPTMFADKLPDYVNATSPRVNAGLGTVPRIVGAGETIYAGKLRFAEASSRVASCWLPFHQALQTLIEETLAEFGACLIIDCHSMPSPPVRPSAGRPATQPDVILGDAYGTSCSPAVTAFLQNQLRGQGFTVRRNDPYAGGYITRHYGRPREAVQVLQIELARGLYMDEASFSRGPGFAALQGQLEQLLRALVLAAPHLLNQASPAAAAE